MVHHNVQQHCSTAVQNVRVQAAYGPGLKEVLQTHSFSKLRFPYSLEEITSLLPEIHGNTYFRNLKNV